MTDKLEKAYVELRKPPSKPGGALGPAIGKVEFQFNPEHYTVTKQATWNHHLAKVAEQTAMPQYAGPKPSNMTIAFLLDSRESAAGRIDADIETLFKCCTPLPETVNKKPPAPSPPFVIFGWGKKISFTAFVQKVEAKYTLFDIHGTPLRAECSITFEEIPSLTGRQNPTSGSEGTRRTRTVVAGDSLPSLAYQEYGGASHWRTIAEVNGIDDPLDIPNGTGLLIPELAAAAPET